MKLAKFLKKGQFHKKRTTSQKSTPVYTKFENLNNVMTIGSCTSDNLETKLYVFNFFPGRPRPFSATPTFSLYSTGKYHLTRAMKVVETSFWA